MRSISLGSTPVRAIALPCSSRYNTIHPGSTSCKRWMPRCLDALWFPLLGVAHSPMGRRNTYLLTIIIQNFRLGWVIVKLQIRVTKSSYVLWRHKLRYWINILFIIFELYDRWSDEAETFWFFYYYYFIIFKSNCLCVCILLLKTWLKQTFIKSKIDEFTLTHVNFVNLKIQENFSIFGQLGTLVRNLKIINKTKFPSY